MMQFKLGCCDGAVRRTDNGNVFTIFHGYINPEMTVECSNCLDSMTALKTETFVLNSPKCVELFKKYNVTIIEVDPE